ncbi:MAG: hypothetical protein Q7T38_02985 [Gallionella sp.]|nr:hypothetical protein [Gallionella sp.]
MINAMFFGINVILLIAVWNLMLKKSILDHYRDQLFDLRGEMREFFVQKDISLDSVAYKNLRDLLNGHLRFTETITFLKFIVLEVEIQKNKELQAYLKAEIDKRFSAEDPALKEFIVQVRDRAKVILLNYMINSSGAALLIAFAFAPAVIVWNLGRVLSYALRTGFSTLSDGLSQSLHEIYSALKFVFAVQAPIKKTVKSDLLEEYSFRFDSTCVALA